ncbi:hypothetical protein CCMA1212_002159 [Trichoderma ghanense]|uniref:Uncharacterized protein n=1 Tax=Trichoderma ghanense TaxID=65468 RepID=A0ABY2HCI4_9HYPO
MMPLSGGSAWNGDTSAVPRKGANRLGLGEAMADKSRLRIYEYAASVSIELVNETGSDSGCVWGV